MANVVMMQMDHYPQPMYASQIDPSLYDANGHPMMTPATHHMVPPGLTMTLSDHSGHETQHYSQLPPDCGPSPFLPEDGASPFGLPTHLPIQDSHSPMLDHLDATRYHGAELHRNNSLPLTNQPQPIMHFPPPRHRTGSASGTARPPMQRGHTLAVPSRPQTLHRQASLQINSARSASPHMMAGDLFDPVPGSPIKRASSALGIPMDQHASMAHQQPQYALQDANFFQPTQGISPARALGPAPTQMRQFPPAVQDDSMITPHGQKNTYAPVIHSSGNSSAVTASSTSTAESSGSVGQAVSEDENDSPTRGPSASRAMQKMQLNERPASSRGDGPVTRQAPALTRPQRPQTKPSGGRTSAKFAKVAEDPGVEGVPPGPRPMDRPGPSFACIIGQAILKSSAGGLSLEHIYRYVETAYPFFKTGDGAWRNSVRHNLSIHKMFETIPRTEKFPPGKGGIWIIHEDEKCHWPEENKFIKNFPSSHPHHASCRQTLHERAKEKDAIEKAAREGRVYIPKKGKKARKLATKDEEDGMEMTRTLSTTSMDMEGSSRFAPSSSGMHPPSINVTPQMGHQPLPFSTSQLGSAPQDDDDGDFLPMESDQVQEDTFEPAMESLEQQLAQRGVMVPPPFEKPRLEKRVVAEDDENVFGGPKRVRLSEPRPQALAPILVQQQEINEWDDTFITPERERPGSSSKAASSSSAFRTPALVNTSSSPGSSPMPPTITRGAHHPSALQQAWTHDDMADAASIASPRDPPKLDDAFDLIPKGGTHGEKKMRARALAAEDEQQIPSIPVGTVPKTPLSRSSALRETARTPATSLAKTPLFNGRSPAQPPPSVTALLSTPMWEVGGCLDRLKGYGGSPTHPGRSPVPPTSPTRYAMLLDSTASPSARKLREFNL